MRGRHCSSQELHAFVRAVSDVSEESVCSLINIIIDWWKQKNKKLLVGADDVEDSLKSVFKTMEQTYIRPFSPHLGLEGYGSSEDFDENVVEDHEDKTVMTTTFRRVFYHKCTHKLEYLVRIDFVLPACLLLRTLSDIHEDFSVFFPPSSPYLIWFWVGF